MSNTLFYFLCEVWPIGLTIGVILTVGVYAAVNIYSKHGKKSYE